MAFLGAENKIVFKSPRACYLLEFRYLPPFPLEQIVRGRE